MKQELEIEQKILCPKCKVDITEVGYQLLRKITGYSIESLKNGGMKEVTAVWTIGKTVLKSTGTKVVNEESATKIVKLALEEFRKIQEPEITKEKVSEIQERTRMEFTGLLQGNEDLKQENKDLRKQNKELEIKFNAALERIEGHFGKFLNIPAFKGAAQEKMIAKTLGGFAKDDEITREKATNEGEDIKAVVMDGNQELGVVCIESKNNSKYSKKYLDQIRGYMSQHKTCFGILAVKVMPDTAQNEQLYEITEDGIWITSLDYLPFCYLAVRELLKKSKQLDIDATKNKEEYIELINKFRVVIEGKQYKEKIIAIRENIQLLRDCSDKLRSYSKNHCDTLNKISNSVINDLASIESMNKEVLVET